MQPVLDIWDGVKLLGVNSKKKKKKKKAKTKGFFDLEISQCILKTPKSSVADKALIFI